jgi:hypothetical protein
MTEEEQSPRTRFVPIGTGMARTSGFFDDSQAFYATLPRGSVGTLCCQPSFPASLFVMQMACGLLTGLPFLMMEASATPPPRSVAVVDFSGDAGDIAGLRCAVMRYLERRAGRPCGPGPEILRFDHEYGDAFGGAELDTVCDCLEEACSRHEIVYLHGYLAHAGRVLAASGTRFKEIARDTGSCVVMDMRIPIEFSPNKDSDSSNVTLSWPSPGTEGLAAMCPWRIMCVQSWPSVMRGVSRDGFKLPSGKNPADQFLYFVGQVEHTGLRTGPGPFFYFYKNARRPFFLPLQENEPLEMI